MLPTLEKELPKISPKAWKQIILANASHNGFGGFISYIGILLTTAINAGFLLQFTTVTTSIGAWLFLKEKMTKSKAITIVAIIIGTFLLVTKGRLDVPHIGDLLIILACMFWSTASVLVRKILREEPVNPDIISASQTLVGVPIQLLLVFLAPLYPLAIRPIFHLSLLDFQFAGYVVIHGILVALLWIFLNRTLKLASASYMTMMTSLTPLIVAVLALSFLHESLSPIQWVGAAIILSSSIATQLLKIEKH